MWILAQFSFAEALAFKSRLNTLGQKYVPGGRIAPRHVWKNSAVTPGGTQSYKTLDDA